MTTDPFRLDGKVVVVTGGSRGIGLAIASEAARAGARGVVIAARNQETLDQARGSVEALGAEAVAVAADVREESGAEAIVERALAAFGRIDTLVNNAGGGSFRGPLRDIRPEGWRRMVDLNLNAAFVVTRAVLRTWNEPAPGRSIVNIGSTSSLRGWADLSYYSAAKHGLVGLTKSLAKEVAREGIRVNLVCPHLVDTELTQVHAAGEVYQQTLAEIPLGRWAEADEIARVVRFLASDAASFMTGAVVAVDGGWSA